MIWKLARDDDDEDRRRRRVHHTSNCSDALVPRPLVSTKRPIVRDENRFEEEEEKKRPAPSTFKRNLRRELSTAASRTSPIRSSHHRPLYLRRGDDNWLNLPANQEQYELENGSTSSSSTQPLDHYGEHKEGERERELDEEMDSWFEEKKTMLMPDDFVVPGTQSEQDDVTSLTMSLYSQPQEEEEEEEEEEQKQDDEEKEADQSEVEAEEEAREEEDEDEEEPVTSLTLSLHSQPQEEDEEEHEPSLPMTLIPSDATTYELYAVVVHHGEAGKGHYISYVRPFTAHQAYESGAWYKFNDNKVDQVSGKQVEDTGRSETENPYLFLYLRRSHVHLCQSITTQYGLASSLLTAPTGLHNSGAVCYLNAYLQVLFHLPLVRILISRYRVRKGEEKKQTARTNVIVALQQVFHTMSKSPHADPAQECVLQAIGWGKKRRQQQDLTEFVQRLFEQLALDREKLDFHSHATLDALPSLDLLFTSETTNYCRRPRLSSVTWSSTHEPTVEDSKLVSRSEPSTMLILRPTGKRARMKALLSHAFEQESRTDLHWKEITILKRAAPLLHIQLARFHVTLQGTYEKDNSLILFPLQWDAGELLHPELPQWVEHPNHKRRALPDDEEVINLIEDEDEDNDNDGDHPKRRITAADDGRGESIEFDADLSLPSTPSRFKPKKRRAVPSILDSLIEAGRLSDSETEEDEVLRFLTAQWKRVQTQKQKKGKLMIRRYTLEALQNMITTRRKELELPSDREKEEEEEEEEEYDLSD